MSASIVIESADETARRDLLNYVNMTVSKLRAHIDHARGSDADATRSSVVAVTRSLLDWPGMRGTHVNLHLDRLLTFLPLLQLGLAHSCWHRCAVPPLQPSLQPPLRSDPPWRPPLPLSWRLHLLRVATRLLRRA
jgi:hypothetical protein